MKKNFIAKIIKIPESKYGCGDLHLRSVGDLVNIHIDENTVYIFSQEPKRPQVLGIINSIEQAKEYLTCIKSTETDVHKQWSKAMDDRYF